MVYIVFIAALILVIILRLTAERKPIEEAVLLEGEALAGAVTGIALGAEALSVSSSACGILQELLERLGVEPELVEAELKRRGFATETGVWSSPEADRDLKVYHANEDIKDALERALLVGIQIARADDDYAGVGDDHLDLERLAHKAEEVELELFGEGRRERYVLYGKVALVLQDMLQGESEQERQQAIRSLLVIFDGQIEALQAELDRSMVPSGESLKWGDSRDRRLYYFKMGVTNSLRRSGQLESLGHLYRYQGVNYDVLEAYDLAAQECSPLFRADIMGIDRLLRMGASEVRALVQQALPEGRGQ